jgi:hypothetical protein
MKFRSMAQSLPRLALPLTPTYAQLQYACLTCHHSNLEYTSLETLSVPRRHGRLLSVTVPTTTKTQRYTTSAPSHAVLLPTTLLPVARLPIAS